MSRKRLLAAVEWLESRTLLAGNVTVSVVGGDLVVTGDAARNRFVVDARGLAAGEVRVRAADDSTTINGEFEAVLGGVTKSFRIDTGPGADMLNVQDLAVAGDLRINGGRAGDTLSLNRVNVAGRSNLMGSGGDDAITVLQSTFGRAVEVRGDEGDDRIILDRSTFGGRAVVLGGAGDDAFSVDTSVFNSGKLVNGQKGRDRVLEAVDADYVFTSRTLGWRSGFSDYPVGRDADWELASGLRTPPAELNWPGQGFLLSGNNHSDDLFMFLKRQLGPEVGLKPNTAYQVRFAVVFGSNGTSGSLGIGGSPGDSVFLKAGATTTEPKPVADQAGDWRMNIDKSDQGQGGRDMTVVDTIANGVTADQASNPPQYKEVERTQVHTSTVTTDAQGRLWVIVGTDSGFEGTTSLYYRSISVRLLPV
ncbi:MAG: hypothetical protein JWN40_569 [Phycisphaerales bacterium]|nr:hypothetical protein [Phycisphaerales bacterium]